ncbi:MAG: cyclic pyranopterin monophosphate synthase MoaC [Gemmatimonadetes bacterium]|nr:cyclic pyranopterin monophosphate synthase MoaC [Gemmatimonadota bacterium]
MTADPRRLTHVDEEGGARMVDVGQKPATARIAVAEGAIRMAHVTLEAIESGRTTKGEVLAVARVAGIMAGKRTGELIPLCHLMPLATINLQLTPDRELPGIRARATASVVASTGVEMEALTAVTVALLTVYDMVKATDRSMVLEAIRLLRKEGGRSGVWVADALGEEEPLPPHQV